MKILMTLQASDPDREYKVERVITIGFDDDQWDAAEAVKDVEKQVLEGIKELVAVSMTHEVVKEDDGEWRHRWVRVD